MLLQYCCIFYFIHYFEDREEMIRYLIQHGAERSGIANEKNPFEIEFEFELKQ